MNGSLQLLWLLAVPASCVAAPMILSRLPEPLPRPLPSEGAAEETELDRMLRAEGPKELYADIGRHPRLMLWAGLVALFLGAIVQVRFPSPPAVVAAALIPIFTVLWIIDWRTRLLPRVVVLPLTMVVCALALIDWAIRRDTDALIREVCGGALAWVIFGLLWFVRRAGMGLGDVRLALSVGMLMAAVSWNAWLIGLYAGFVAFAFFGVGLTLITRDRSVLKRAYPFGPFMIAGAYVGMTLSLHLTVLG